MVARVRARASASLGGRVACSCLPAHALYFYCFIVCVLCGPLCIFTDFLWAFLFARMARVSMFAGALRRDLRDAVAAIGRDRMCLGSGREAAHVQKEEVYF